MHLTCCVHVPVHVLDMLISPAGGSGTMIAGGGAPAGEDQLGMDEQELEDEEEVVKEEVETKSEDLWIDFDEFCKCFK